MKDKEEFIRYIRKTGTSLGVNIPKEIIKLLNLKGDDMLRVTIEKIKKGGKD